MLQRIYIQLSVLLLLLSVSSYAQSSWQWGISGGSPFNNINTSPYEETVDMATDKQGNLYTLAQIETSGAPTLGNRRSRTVITPVYGYRDIMISSFKCDGTLRWNKVIGSNDGDIPRFLGADTLGHIFVCGLTPVQRTINFSGDTILSNYEKGLFIASYDTSGRLLWLRYPVPDTIPMLHQYYYQCYDMVVDPNGTVNMLCYMTPGLLAGGGNWVVPSEGTYMLRYNAQGTITGLTPFQIQQDGYGSVSQNATGVYMRMQHSPGGKWAVAGSYVSYLGGPFALGGQPVTKPFFVSLFRDNGQLLWVRTNDSSYSGTAGRPAIDRDGNIYVTGSTWNGDKINGDSIATIASGSIPLVLKLDSNGRTVWLSYAQDNSTPVPGGFLVHGGASGSSIALSSGEVAITGGCGPLLWGGKHIDRRPNTGYHVFIARLNAFTGTVLKLDSISDSQGSGYSSGSCIVAAKNGGYYIGGQLRNTMYVRNDTLDMAGGMSDMFVAKYGYVCNCTAPKAAIGVSGAALSRTFTYTGTTPVDSVIWYFGDGQSAKGTTQTHAYALSGVGYTVCAIAYTSCGTDMKCISVDVAATGVGTLAGTPLRVYPNPASDLLSVSGAGKGYHYQLYTITGVKVQAGDLDAGMAQVDIRTLMPGVYMLEISDANGGRMRQRILKQ